MAVPLLSGALRRCSRAVQAGGLTLDGGLRAEGGQSAHGADHEVLEDLGALLAVLVPVGGEGGDLGAVGAALEGAVERRGRGVTGLHGGAAGPGDGHLVGCP